MDIENITYIIRTVLRESYFSLLSFLPYILPGILIGELLKITSWTKIIYKAVLKTPVISCITASLLGIASPLCTFGTIPVAISLYTSGVSPAPLLAFISTSSLLNPQFIIYTWGTIGPKMAIARIVSVFFIGLVISLIAAKIPKERIVSGKLSNKFTDGADILNKQKKFDWKIFLTGIRDSSEHILFYVIAGILIANTVLAIFPPKTIAALFAEDKWYSVLLAAVAGVPLYQCGGGVIPLIGIAMKNGMGFGQALTFFLAGPATNAQPIISMATILKPKAVIGYLFIVISLSLLFGYLADPILSLFT